MLGIGWIGLERNAALLLLAALIGALCAGTVCGMLRRARQSRDRLRLSWQAGAALAFAGSLWATYSIALLAFDPGLPAVDATLAGAGPASGTAGLPAGLLATAIAAMTLTVLGACLALMLLDTYLRRRWAAEKARLHRIADSTFEGILFHRDGIVTDANGPLCGLLGRPASDLVGRPVAHFLALVPDPADDAPPHPGAPRPGRAEAQLLPADGSRRSVEVLSRSLYADGGRTMVTAVRDLSDRRQAEQRIQQLAHYDPLTGLANRTLFRDRLAQALAVAERSGGGVTLLLLDLDGFKAVNDLMGHPAGDRLLVEVGNRLTVTVREMDTIARLGGDEFAVVQPWVTEGSAAPRAMQPEAAQALATRIVQTLSEPFELEGRPVRIGVSVGIAAYPDDARTPEVLMRDADMALYRAKAEGRGTWRFFEAGMDQRLQERRRLEQDLRRGLDRDEFQLHYQPLFDSASLRIEGYEALIRWHHPEKGRIPPADFIPLAEECGFIVPLGRWVLETACAEAARWPQPHRIAVNLSPAQFRSRGLAEQVAEVLARTGLEPSRLELEVTEGVLAADPDAALAALRALKAQGIRIALDDFGTGYSSLGYLRRFPFDKLKIDRSFVQALGEDAEADAIVRSVVALSRSLRLDVTAEGVETQAQLDLLRAENCRQVQGFLLGRPMPCEERLTEDPAPPLALAAD